MILTSKLEFEHLNILSLW